MPRQTRAYGRPDTPVIPTDWAADHAAVVDRTHAATVTITAHGDPQFDPQTRRTRTTPAVVYTGPASLTQTAAGDVQTAGDQLLAASYDVTLPAGADAVTAGQRLTVDDCPGDLALQGHVLTVATVALGDTRFARHLTATFT